jgi:glycosyltransferase involved in cell wall biosynthesis
MCQKVIMTNRRISVIVPVYNGEHYLAAAIASVIDQTYAPAEIIVVDDGSTDRTAKVANGFGAPVRYEHRSHLGSPDAARNRGVELAHGEYLTFLDQDDLWVRNKLDVQMAASTGDDSLDIIFGHVEQFLSPDLPEEMAKQMHYPTGIKPGRILSAMMVKRSTFRRVGWFSTKWRLSGFLDWYARAMELGLRETMLPQIVARRRIHSANLNIVQRHAQVDYVRAVKASLDRRRLASFSHVS